MMQHTVCEVIILFCFIVYIIQDKMCALNVFSMSLERVNTNFQMNQAQAWPIMSRLEIRLS